jgi:hypothetical protein
MIAKQVYHLVRIGSPCRRGHIWSASPLLRVRRPAAEMPEKRKFAAVRANPFAPWIVNDSNSEQMSRYKRFAPGFAAHCMSCVQSETSDAVDIAAFEDLNKAAIAYDEQREKVIKDSRGQFPSTVYSAVEHHWRVPVPAWYPATRNSCQRLWKAGVQQVVSLGDMCTIRQGYERPRIRRHSKGGKTGHLLPAPERLRWSSNEALSGGGGCLEAGAHCFGRDYVAAWRFLFECHGRGESIALALSHTTVSGLPTCNCNASVMARDGRGWMTNLSEIQR